MILDIIPTNTNCVRLCAIANAQYKIIFLKGTIEDLSIINWRVKYIPLKEFIFPIKFINHPEVRLFTLNYETSIDIFYDLIDKNEKNNLTERVWVSISQISEPTMLYLTQAAVSPTDISTINEQIIEAALVDANYGAFYIDNDNLNIKKENLKTLPFIILVGESGELVYEETEATIKVVGILILNLEINKEMILALNNPEVRIQIERVVKK